MQIITDAYSDEGKKIIEQMISRYGTAAEHNYHCYINNIKDEDENASPYIYLVEDDMGILAMYEPKKNEYRIFTEILAPKERKADLLKAFLDHVFSLERKPSKVWAELETDTRQNLLKVLKNSPYKSNTPTYTLIWPVFDMSTWNGDLMQGGEWKDMRYYWNKFFRDHKVEFVTADKVSKKELIDLVHAWKKSRTTGDRAYIEYYLHTIEDDFKGYDITRIMLVDGKIGAITAGFTVRKGYYYSSIGLYNTEIPRCNEVANMDDLINLKKLGIEVVDFGGIEEEHLEFKKKFRPSRYYETHMFSIVLRDVKPESAVSTEVESSIEVKSNFVIIKTKPSDWSRIKDGILLVEKEGFEEGIRYEEEDFDSFLSDNTVNYIVMDDKNKIIGYLMSCPIENDTGYAEDAHFGKHDTIHAESIALMVECRGKGVGKMLFEKFLSDSRDLGFKRVVLDATSPQMIGLALKYDFKKIKFYEDWQAGRSSWYMEKML